MKKLKRLLVVLLLLTAAFFIYVEIVNRNSVNMTYRQKILKAIYPAWMWWAKLTGKNSSEASGKKSPKVSFYSLEAEMNDGSKIDFSKFKGKKVMLVNTASNCGYTNQYSDLQSLYEKHKDSLIVLGFPSNDFKEQEKGTDEEIAQFCKVNFGVSFPLMKKSIVKRSAGQNQVYQWLTDSSKNGWSGQSPEWNFSKYIINEEGALTHYFGPTIPPASNEILDAIKVKP
jgi:glutathione peroxidase